MRRFACAALAAASALLSGCEAYQLRGRVVHGDASYATVVDRDDPRLQEGAGVPGVTLTLETDPERINREVAGRAVADGDGAFAVPFSEPGGGLLLYDVGITARRDGYEGVYQTFALPPSGKRLLIVLAPGEDRTGRSREEDPWDQYERFRRP